MSSGSFVDCHYNDNCSRPRGFLTPPPTWRTNRRSPVMPRSEMKPKTTPQQLKGDMFHIIHKIPSGDSPYVRAKHVQLVEKDPSRAISLFWASINAGDRVDSALKDMAVVMKQLNRSDEAIEAIKSFRHLSPPESQESLDNILVELFKQSGRREEEIELLQRKLMQVEDGLAFSGRKTKMARSQGKKIQITVQKEYSRLLGNLAWAYMQNGDFKSAEEHYRKALSFEADKNKQCNLAVCLMHMNKLTEAKFLLQTIPSANGSVDESYAKSYERASEILAEFESRNVLWPKKQMEQTNKCGMVTGGSADGHPSKAKTFGAKWGSSRFCSQRHSDDGNTDFVYEKRADFDWRVNRCEPNVRLEGVCSSGNRGSESSKVALTQPRRCLSSGDQRKPDKRDDAHGSYCRKLSFGSSASRDTAPSFANQNGDYECYSAPDEMPKIFPHFLEKFNGGEKQRSSSPCVKPPTFSTASGKLEESSDRNPCKKISRCDEKKSWADMVDEEEEEDEFGSWKSSFSVAATNQEGGFNDENMNSNIVSETPKLHEKAGEEMGLMDLGGGYLTQPDETAVLSKRRSLCFDEDQILPGLQKLGCSSPLTAKILDFEGQSGGDDGGYRNRRRLQVFQDITRDYVSPRHSDHPSMFGL